MVILGTLPWIGLEYSRRMRRILFIIMIVAIGTMIMLLLAEYEFFREFQTRYNQLAFQYLDQPKTVVRDALGELIRF